MLNPVGEGDLDGTCSVDLLSDLWFDVEVRESHRALGREDPRA